MAAVAQVQQFSCVVPAATPVNNPAIFPMGLLALDVEWIEWEVPPGPRGNVGFWIGSHGQPIIPYSSGAVQWIVTDGRFVHWDLTDQPDSGDWELRAYNLGVDPHTIYVRWGLAPGPKATATGGGPPAIATIPSSVLSSVG